MGNDYPRSLLEYLRRVGLTLEEYMVLEILNYGSCSRGDVIARAVGESREQAGRGFLPAVDRRSCTRGVTKLIRAGLVCEVNAEMVSQIVNFLLEKPAYGPLDGLPFYQHVDMTLQGGTVWAGIERSVGHGSSRTFQEQNYGDYSCTVRLCESSERNVKTAFASVCDELSELADGRLLSVEGPRAIGPWRDRWWRAATRRGYLIDALFSVSNSPEKFQSGNVEGS